MFPMLATDLIIEQLAAHRTLSSGPRDELAWIAAHCRTRDLKVGEVPSSRQRPVEGLHIVISGLITLHVDRGAGNRRVMEWRGGDVTGARIRSTIIAGVVFMACSSSFHVTPKPVRRSRCAARCRFQGIEALGW